MYRTIIIEGGDGVGKTTLAKNIANQITERVDNFEGFFLRFPSEGLEGFRDFFLAQKGRKPALRNGEVVWTDTYTSKIRPLTNLLNILADFSYVFSALPFSPDVLAACRRGTTPVFVVDREMLSTIVYQIVYAFSADKAEFDDVKKEKSHLFDVLRFIVDESVLHQSHDMLVHLHPANMQTKRTGRDVFDLYDQDKIQHYFSTLVESIKSNQALGGMSFLTPTNLKWLRGRYTTIQTFPAFSKPSEDLANEVIDLFVEQVNEYQEA